MRNLYSRGAKAEFHLFAHPLRRPIRLSDPVRYFEIATVNILPISLDPV